MGIRGALGSYRGSYFQQADIPARGKESSMRSEQINELATALAKAQAEMKPAKFNRVNPHFKNKYADLAAIFEAVRTPLSKHGLSITQTESWDEHGGCLVTTLWHSSGQFVSSTHPLPTGAKPQEFGSALTYAKRYSLSSLVGIAADEDDDAEEAQKAEVAPRKPEVAKPVPLTAAEIEDIRFYTKELDSDRIQKFLKWMNVKSINELGRHQYDRAISGLKKAVGETIGTGSGGGPAMGQPTTREVSAAEAIADEALGAVKR